MSRLLGSELTADLLRRFDGRDLESHASKVIPLLTVDQSGWPHVALLSYFEVAAKDPRHVRVATDAGSTTSANMRRSGKMTLVVVDERVSCYVKGTATEIAAKMRSAGWNAAFDCRVEQVLVDEVDEAREPGAYVASGMTYVTPRRAADIERGRQVVAELLER
jgi:pyridoxamine 5'-phosphate oxidase-like protein